MWIYSDIYPALEIDHYGAYNGRPKKPVTIDANNIAAVEYGALDGEDEKDARAVPKIASQFELSFLDRIKQTGKKSRTEAV